QGSPPPRPPSSPDAFHGLSSPGPPSLRPGYAVQDAADSPPNSAQPQQSRHQPQGSGRQFAGGPTGELKSAGTAVRTAIQPRIHGYLVSSDRRATSPIGADFDASAV